MIDRIGWSLARASRSTVNADDRRRPQLPALQARKWSLQGAGRSLARRPPSSQIESERLAPLKQTLLALVQLCYLAALAGRPQNSQPPLGAAKGGLKFVKPAKQVINPLPAQSARA